MIWLKIVLQLQIIIVFHVSQKLGLPQTWRITTFCDLSALQEKHRIHLRRFLIWWDFRTRIHEWWPKIAGGNDPYDPWEPKTKNVDVMMDYSHRIHVWHIYLHESLMFMVSVGKYTIHGSYGWWCHAFPLQHLQMCCSSNMTNWQTKSWQFMARKCIFGLRHTFCVSKLSYSPHLPWGFDEWHPSATRLASRGMVQSHCRAPKSFVCQRGSWNHMFSSCNIHPMPASCKRSVTQSYSAEGYRGRTILVMINLAEQMIWYILDFV